MLAASLDGVKCQMGRRERERGAECGQRVDETESRRG